MNALYTYVLFSLPCLMFVFEFNMTAGSIITHIYIFICLIHLYNCIFNEALLRGILGEATANMETC